MWPTAFKYLVNIITAVKNRGYATMTVCLCVCVCESRVLRQLWSEISCAIDYEAEKKLMRVITQILNKD